MHITIMVKSAEILFIVWVVLHGFKFSVSFVTIFLPFFMANAFRCMPIFLGTLVRLKCLWQKKGICLFFFIYGQFCSWDRVECWITIGQILDNCKRTNPTEKNSKIILWRSSTTSISIAYTSIHTRTYISLPTIFALFLCFFLGILTICEFSLSSAKSLSHDTVGTLPFFFNISLMLATNSARFFRAVVDNPVVKMPTSILPDSGSVADCFNASRCNLMMSTWQFIT